MNRCQHRQQEKDLLGSKPQRIFTGSAADFVSLWASGERGRYMENEWAVRPMRACASRCLLSIKRRQPKFPNGVWVKEWIILDSDLHEGRMRLFESQEWGNDTLRSNGCSQNLCIWGNCQLSEGLCDITVGFLFRKKKPCYCFRAVETVEYTYCPPKSI